MNKKEFGKYKMKKTLRLAKTERKYMKFIQDKLDGKIDAKKCIFCEKELLVREFKQWVILRNRFPYDKLYEISHMLAPKRHAAKETDLTINEIIELRRIKKKHLKDYHVILENVGHRISIKNHFHLHLLTFYS